MLLRPGALLLVLVSLPASAAWTRKPDAVLHARLLALIASEEKAGRLASALGFRVIADQVDPAAPNAPSREALAGRAAAVNIPAVAFTFSEQGKAYFTPAFSKFRFRLDQDRRVAWAAPADAEVTIAWDLDTKPRTAERKRQTEGTFKWWLGEKRGAEREFAYVVPYTLDYLTVRLPLVAQLKRSDGQVLETLLGAAVVTIPEMENPSPKDASKMGLNPKFGEGGLKAQRMEFPDDAWIDAHLIPEDLGQRLFRQALDAALKASAKPLEERLAAATDPMVKHDLLIRLGWRTGNGQRLGEALKLALEAAQTTCEGIGSSSCSELYWKDLSETLQTGTLVMRTTLPRTDAAEAEKQGLLYAAWLGHFVKPMDVVRMPTRPEEAAALARIGKALVAQKTVSFALAPADAEPLSALLVSAVAESATSLPGLTRLEAPPADLSLGLAVGEARVTHTVKNERWVVPHREGDVANPAYEKDRVRFNDAREQARRQQQLLTALCGQSADAPYRGQALDSPCETARFRRQFFESISSDIAAVDVSRPAKAFAVPAKVHRFSAKVALTLSGDVTKAMTREYEETVPEYAATAHLPARELTLDDEKMKRGAVREGGKLVGKTVRRGLANSLKVPDDRRSLAALDVLTHRALLSNTPEAWAELTEAVAARWRVQLDSAELVKVLSGPPAE